MFSSFYPEKYFSPEIYKNALFSHVLKNDIAEFLGEKPSPKVKKPELIEKLKAKFEEDPLALRRYYKEFRDELAVSPFDTENVIGCTKTERLRWTKEGKLEVVRYDTCKYGDFPLYDRWFIDHLPQDKVAAWREEHKAEVAKNRAGAAAKAQETRRKNADKKATFKREFEAIRKDWYKSGFEKGSMMELAYWTMWANRWAKLNEVKEWAAKRMDTREKYAGKKESWYGKKNEAIKVLASSALGKLSFYRPDDPDKISVYFCDRHFEEFREERSYGIYERVMDAYWCDPKKYERCPDCKVEKEHDYYSLYFLEIGDDECRFSFHTPFPIGKDFLPSRKAIPSIEQDEGEGMFRFGRPLNPEEVVTHTEKLVGKKLDEALEQAKKYIPEDFHFETLGKDDKPEKAEDSTPADYDGFTDPYLAEDVKYFQKKHREPVRIKSPYSKHPIVIEERELTLADGTSAKGFCLIDKNSGDIIPFPSNYSSSKKSLMNEWNQLKYQERTEIWVFWKYLTKDGFHAKILSSEEAEAIGLPCRTPFVLVEAETGKPIRFYDETNRSRIVKSWRKSGKKALRERITAWVLENKSFLHNVLSIVEKKKNTRGNLDVSDVVHARKKSFLKAGDIPFSKEDLVWFFRSTPEIQWVEREEFEPKE